MMLLFYLFEWMEMSRVLLSDGDFGDPALCMDLDVYVIFCLVSGKMWEKESLIHCI